MVAYENSHIKILNPKSFPGHSASSIGRRVKWSVNSQLVRIIIQTLDQKKETEKQKTTILNSGKWPNYRYKLKESLNFLKIVNGRSLNSELRLNLDTLCKLSHLWQQHSRGNCTLINKIRQRLEFRAGKLAGNLRGKYWQ